jgi:hypothetical protein
VQSHAYDIPIVDPSNETHLVSDLENRRIALIREMMENPLMILKYRSGEEIKKGDRVLFHRNPAQIEFVACHPAEAETDWYIQEFGGGVMILDPMVSGRTFVQADQIDEDLEFVSRA